VPEQKAAAMWCWQQQQANLEGRRLRPIPPFPVEATMDKQIDYFAGLDLGKPSEFTALAVLERTRLHEGGSRSDHFAVRHLQRFSIGTGYPEICATLARLFADPPLRGAMLAVDQTAVGKPVLAMLRRAPIGASIRPLTVTGGHRASLADGSWLVPKQELVSTLQVLFQTRRLKVAAGMLEAELLVQELLNFRMKVRVASEDPLSAWREGHHDDLVLAAACAAWTGERGTQRLWVA